MYIHALRTHDDQISNFLQFKTISQSQIENPLKCMKILAFYRKKRLSNQSKYLGYFKKSSHWVSVVRVYVHTMNMGRQEQQFCTYLFLCTPIFHMIWNLGMYVDKVLAKICLEKKRYMQQEDLVQTFKNSGTPLRKSAKN